MKRGKLDPMCCKRLLILALMGVLVLRADVATAVAIASDQAAASSKDDESAKDDESDGLDEQPCGERVPGEEGGLPATPVGEFDVEAEEILFANLHVDSESCDGRTMETSGCLSTTRTIVPLWIHLRN
ncbi:MAG: hypothetical protein L0211_20500 [Planctomycetaceae bacterium]|nr:hypothetical protein [Planctomycetaceae bacterium]